VINQFDSYSIQQCLLSERKQPKPKLSRGTSLLWSSFSENEPDTIVGPVLDNLVERINWA
jgi:hypothetical protein